MFFYLAGWFYPDCRLHYLICNKLVSQRQFVTGFQLKISLLVESLRDIDIFGTDLMSTAVAANKRKPFYSRIMFSKYQRWLQSIRTEIR